MECLFCNIINGEMDSKKIYESDEVIAILDIYPDAFGHVLVIPKVHSDDLLSIDFPNNILNEIQIVAKLMKNKLNCSGIKMINNNGQKAGQVIFHTHFHLIPFYDTQVPEKNEIDQAYAILSN
jgi:histidine triad (HIT) family protein